MRRLVKQTKVLLLAGTVFVLPFSGFSQTSQEVTESSRDTGDTDKTAQASTPPEKAKKWFKTEELENGLDVVTFVSKKVPLVTISLNFKAGGMTETPELNGLTHLWEHMFFKGNKKIKTQEEFRRKIRQLGISYNGDTSAEKVRYYFTLPSVFLEEGIEFMADAIRTPNLDEGELEKERKVVLNEYQRSESNPGFMSRNATRKIIYGSEEYQRDPLGKKQVIMAATRKQLDQIKDEVFVPKNGSIVVGGNIDHDEVLTLIKKHFGDWKNPKNWAPPKRPALPDFPKTASYNFSHSLTQDAKLLMTYRGPRARFDQKDSFAADMLIGLLNHRSGQFYNKFINSGKTFSAGLGYHTQSHAGQVNLYAHAKSAKIENIKKALLSEILLWEKSDYFTEEQLEDVKRGLLIGHKMETAQASSYVKTLAFWWSVVGLDYYEGYIDSLNSVTLKDIRAFVSKYLVGKSHIDTVLYNEKDAEELKVKLNGDEYVKNNLKEYL